MQTEDARDFTGKEEEGYKKTIPQNPGNWKYWVIKIQAERSDGDEWRVVRDGTGAKMKFL